MGKKPETAVAKHDEQTLPEAIPKVISTAKAFETVMQYSKTKVINSLPSGMDKEWFMARLSAAFARLQAKLAVDNKPCNFTALSCHEAALTAAYFGVDPAGSLNSGFFVPYGNILQFQCGYNGLRELVMRTGYFQSVESQVVYEGEKVELDLATKTVKHPVDFAARKGEIVGAYMLAVRTDGSRYLEIMSKNELDKAKRNTPAWRDWPGEMYRKTVLKRGCKHLPVSSQDRRLIDKAVEHDNAVESRYPNAVNIEAERVDLVDRLTGAKQAPEAEPDLQPDPKPITEPEAPEQAPPSDTQEAQPPKKEKPDIGWGKKPKRIFDPVWCGDAKCSNVFTDDNGELKVHVPCEKMVDCKKEQV